MVKSLAGKDGGWAREVSRVLPWLFLSGARVVRPKLLADFGVTCVVNATAELPELTLDGVEVIAARITDSEDANLRPFLHDIADKLLQVRQANGKALVHCVAGVSRSPALVLAYLLKHEGLTLREAFLLLRQVRPAIRPNTNFFRQLVEFEEEVRLVRSVHFVVIPDSNLTIPDVCENELARANSRPWVEMVLARRNLANQFA